ncbi:MAG TPA: precorrin-2 C(20)-methyltransferase [Stellaceae bacterium]|nr:precorrin-2 C(20)-methyltransferase [Stellaceae bacterium]
MTGAGRIYGLGIGPGDPELLTLKAHRILQRVPVIAYPAPDDAPSLARVIAAPHLPGGQREIVIRVPMRVERFPAAQVYDKAARELLEETAAGRDVAVLCEGDPFFYGSFMYLFARLAGHAAVEIVPGVSSLTACAGALGAPLAARNDTLTVVPAPLDEAAIEASLASCDGAAIIKLGRHFAKVRSILERAGLAGRARYIEHASMSDQRIVPLEAVDPSKVPYFSMIIVHRRGEAWS